MTRPRKFTNLFELSEDLGVQFTDVQRLIRRNKISIREQDGYLMLNSDSSTDNDQNDESIFDEQIDEPLHQQYLDDLESIVLTDDHIVKSFPLSGDPTLVNY